jgi:hypothetical protein
MEGKIVLMPGLAVLLIVVTIIYLHRLGGSSDFQHQNPQMNGFPGPPRETALAARPERLATSSGAFLEAGAAPRLSNPPQSPQAREASYQAAPLSEYDPRFQQKAANLFKKLQARLGKGMGRTYKCSYSIFGSVDRHTVVKIIIFEAERGKVGGHPLSMADGVYALVRADGSAGKRIWAKRLDFQNRISREETIGIAPHYSERFAFFGISEQDDEGTVVDFIEQCVKA